MLSMFYDAPQRWNGPFFFTERNPTYHITHPTNPYVNCAHLDEQFLQFSGLGFVSLGPFCCA